MRWPSQLHTKPMPIPSQLKVCVAVFFKRLRMLGIRRVKSEISLKTNVICTKMDAKTRTKTLCMLKNYLLESRDSGLTDYAIETPSNLMQHSFSSGTRASLFCSGIHDPKRKRRPDRVIKRSADVRGCWNNIWRSLAPRTLGLSQCCQKKWWSILHQDLHTFSKTLNLFKIISCLSRQFEMETSVCGWD